MAALRRSAATALARRLRFRSSASTSTSTSTSTSFLARFSSTSSERGGGGEGSVHFDDGSGEKLAEVLDHALAKDKPKSSSSSFSDPAATSAAAVLTTRREALSLYRSIWRATALFTWSTTAEGKASSPSSPFSSSTPGEPWRDALRRSARAEFEASRLERDPVAVARMLVVGRDAVAQAVDRLAAKAAEVERGLRRSSGGGGGGGGDSGGSSGSLR